MMISGSERLGFVLVFIAENKIGDIRIFADSAVRRKYLRMFLSFVLQTILRRKS